MCQMVERLQGAIDDLKELLTIQPANELVQQLLHQIEVRIQELISE